MNIITYAFTLNAIIQVIYFYNHIWGSKTFKLKESKETKLRIHFYSCNFCFHEKLKYAESSEKFSLTFAFENFSNLKLIESF